MGDRVRTLCRTAAEANLRIMIDAEHQYFQPAIDSIAKDMMREFNGGDVPIVYNTYQCYLKDSRFRLNADIESARRQGYKFGAKLVRGAYMVRAIPLLCSTCIAASVSFSFGCSRIRRKGSAWALPSGKPTGHLLVDIFATPAHAMQFSEYISK